MPAGEAVNSQPSADLIEAVKSDLEPRRLLTTQLHVVGPRDFVLDVHLTLVLKPDALEAIVHPTAIKALLRYFDPFTGGEDGRGWPFGRA